MLFLREKVIKYHSCYPYKCKKIYKHEEIFQKEQVELARKENVEKKARKLGDHSRRTQHPNNKNSRRKTKRIFLRRTSSRTTIPIFTFEQTLPCREWHVASWNTSIPLSDHKTALVFHFNLLTGVKNKPQYKGADF